jgi:DNA-binding Xre family transcriptional regulator
MSKFLPGYKPPSIQTSAEYLAEVGIEPVGWNLDRLMFIRGLSAHRLSREISYSDAMVNKWRKSPTVPNFRIPRDALRNLCRALNCEIIHLVGNPSVLDELEA